MDEELDRMKHVYNGIDSVLVSSFVLFLMSIVFFYSEQSKVAEQISTTVPSDYATSLNVVYFPQLGEFRLNVRYHRHEMRLQVSSYACQC